MLRAVLKTSYNYVYRTAVIKKSKLEGKVNCIGTALVCKSGSWPHLLDQNMSMDFFVRHLIIGKFFAIKRNIFTLMCCIYLVETSIYLFISF